MVSFYMSKAFLSILAVPNKTDFCTIAIFKLIPSVSIHPLKPFLMHTQSSYNHWYNLNLFSDEDLFSSLFKFWYFSIFSISFSRILQSPGIATSMMTHDFVLVSTKVKSSLLASTTLSHWIFISQINLKSSFSTTPSGPCSYHFSFLSRLCFSHNFQWTNFATASCLLLCSRCASFFHSHIICCSLSPFTTHFTQWIFQYLFFFYWDSLHANLNSHYKAWSYKKKKHKKIKAYKKSV